MDVSRVHVPMASERLVISALPNGRNRVLYGGHEITNDIRVALDSINTELRFYQKLKLIWYSPVIRL